MKINRVDQNDNWIDGIIITGVITVIVLKIAGIITIPWIWLLSPLWICAIAGIIGLSAITLIYLIRKYIITRRNKER